MERVGSRMMRSLSADSLPRQWPAAIGQSGSRIGIASDITQIRPTLASDCRTVTKTEHRTLDGGARLEKFLKKVCSERKQFSDQIIANAWKRHSSSTPKGLKRLASQAYWGKMRGRTHIDRAASMLVVLDSAYRCFTEPLLEGAGAAVQDAMGTFKDKDLRQEIAEEGVRQGKSCEEVATSLKMTPPERDALDIYAVKSRGIPRVKQGESCKRVFTDLEIRGPGPATELLQDFAAHGPGMIRVARGEDWMAVSQSLEFDPEDYYGHILHAYSALGPGIARVRQGENGLAVAIDLGLFQFGYYEGMLCHPEEWEEFYQSEVVDHERMMNAIADPESFYECLVKELLEELSANNQQAVEISIERRWPRR